RPRPRHPDPERDEFSSAHDTHANLLIDKFYHSTGEPFRDKNSDSVWNFHVLERDVDDAAGPRQALQRLAGCGRHTAGSERRVLPDRAVSAVGHQARARSTCPHDANFIFSERVNACVKRYVSPDNGGDLDRGPFRPRVCWEVPQHQARREQATFERAARELARQAGNERLPPPRVSPDGQGGSRVAPAHPAWPGRQLRHRVRPGRQRGGGGEEPERQGQGAAPATASAVLRNSAGKDLKELSVENVKLDLPANVGQILINLIVLCFLETTAKLSINAWQYTEFGNEEVDIVIQASLTDTENRVQTLDHVIGILYPDLLIRVPESIKKYRTSEIVVELKNDLEFALTDAKFSIEAPGLRSYDLEQKVDDIEPGAEAAATFKVRFYRAGPITLVASFSSKQVTGVFQQASFYVGLLLSSSLLEAVCQTPGSGQGINPPQTDRPRNCLHEHSSGEQTTRADFAFNISG
uniref:Transglut_C domain-containing protein n=1 Tax=Macrostomum lignano TaxID=282301 RepID=A0A1I8JNY4_9PLAT